MGLRIFNSKCLKDIRFMDVTHKYFIFCLSFPSLSPYLMDKKKNQWISKELCHLFLTFCFSCYRSMGVVVRWAKVCSTAVFVARLLIMIITIESLDMTRLPPRPSDQLLSLTKAWSTCGGTGRVHGYLSRYCTHFWTPRSISTTQLGCIRLKLRYHLWCCYPFNLENKKIFMKVKDSVSVIRSVKRWFIFFFCFYTSTKSWRGYIFTAVCLCVCVCLSVCLCVWLNSCEQNSSRTDEPIWTRFSLNGGLEHWLKPYWNWWPRVKDQGHCDRKCI